MEELSNIMSIFLFPFYITDPMSYTNNNVETDKKNTTHNRTPHWIPVWKSSHRQLQHCVISGFHCGIKEIFILLEFLVTDVSGQLTSHIFNGPAKLPQNISNYQKMLCNIPEEQRFQLQNLS